MNTLLKVALGSVLAYVVVKWARRRVAETLPTLSPVVGGGPVEAWQPDAADPLRGDNLSVEPPVTH